MSLSQTQRWVPCMCYFQELMHFATFARGRLLGLCINKEAYQIYIVPLIRCWSNGQGFRQNKVTGTRAQFLLLLLLLKNVLKDSSHRTTRGPGKSVPFCDAFLCYCSSSSCCVVLLPMCSGSDLFLFPWPGSWRAASCYVVSYCRRRTSSQPTRLLPFATVHCTLCAVRAMEAIQSTSTSTNR